MNIFSEFFFSIFGVKKYSEFLKNKGGKVFLYIMFVVFIYTCIANAKAIPGTKIFIEEAREFIEYELPYFELKNGEFYIEEPVYLEDDKTFVSADCENGSYIKQYDKSEWMQMLADYDSAIMLDTSTILIKDEAQIEMMDFARNFSFSRDSLYDLIESAYVIVGIYLILAYIFNILKFLFATLIVALVGLIIDSFVGYGLTYGQLFKLSIYAKTCMLIIKALFKLFGINFFGFTLLAIVISGVYLGCALSGMKNKDEQDKRYGEPIIF